MTDVAGLQGGRVPGRRTVRLVRKYYFPAVTGLLLFLTLAGFSDNLLTNVGQRSNGDPKFIIHGLFCLAWMVILTTQANLVRAGNIRLHRKLGIAGFIVAIGVTLSTLFVFWAVWKGWDRMPFYIQANRVLLPSYAVLVALAFLNRRRPDWHKRLILVASLYMLEPVLSRSFDPLDPLLLRFTDSQVDTAWWIYFVTVWNALFLSLFAYDWIVARRIHPVTAGGYAWFGTIFTVLAVT